MNNIKNKFLKKLIGSMTMLGMLITNIAPVHAMILFIEDDVFENTSETYQIGSNDDSTSTTLSLEFGGINPESITWDTTQFNLSDDLNIMGGITATDTVNFSGSNSFRIREDTDPTTNATCSTIGELIFDTTDNQLQRCTATGSPGSWTNIDTTGGSADFEGVYGNDVDKILITSNGNFTITTGTGDFIVNSNDWNVDAAGNITANDINANGTTFTLDSDNTGVGADVSIVAEQGTDLNGVLRYNATINRWEISNDGAAFVGIATGSGDLDDAYSNDTDKILNVDNVSGLEFESTVVGDVIIDLQSTGDFVIQDAGVTYGTFTDTGEFRLDNLQLDANTISSTDVNGDINMNPNGIGVINLNAETNIAGNTTVLDSDNTGGNVVLQFGQALAEALTWDSANTRFTFTDDLRVEGNGAIIGQLYLADNHVAATSDGILNLGRSGSTWEVLNFDSVTGQFELSDDFRIDGNIGLNIDPTFNFHLFDTTSTVAHEWQVFDNGTDQVSVLTGTQDPTVTATDADIGSVFLNTVSGILFTKQDDGLTINWEKGGLDSDLNDALLGTFGTPSLTNKFVTDTDPRLSATSGTFGEAALGSHLDYPATNQTISNTFIYYIRIFLPADTTINSFAIFTTQTKTGNVNYGIYSHNPTDSIGEPGTKLADVGVTASTSPVNDFWGLSLGTPLDITTAGFYWLAYASSVSPKAHQFLGAEDKFIPFRVETKSSSSAVLPTTANVNAKGSSYNLPYMAGFE